jgi:hypothetical protein
MVLIKLQRNCFSLEKAIGIEPMYKVVQPFTVHTTTS